MKNKWAINHKDHKNNVIPHLMRNLSSLENETREEILKQVQDGGKRNGFTLIELLVVVLIIGILASIAVPQYRTAVYKSRFMAMFAIAKDIKNAEEYFHLSTGDYTNDWELLSLSVPGRKISSSTFLTSDNIQLILKKNVSGAPDSIYASWDKIPGVLLIISWDKSSWNGLMACYASSSSDVSKGICKAISKKKNPSECDSMYCKYFFAFK